MVSNTKELNPPISPADVAALDPAYWAQLRKIKLQAGEFSFVDREYQLEPMRSTAKRKVFMKATQMGFTEIAVLMTLHGMIYGHYLRGVMYIFPTEDNVQDFSRSRFGPLIDANRETIGRFVKSGGKGTDTVRLKKVRDAFLYLRGARASTTVGVGLEEKETVGLRSAPVDCLVYDELDLMGDAVIGQARGRIAASSKGHEIFLSNPIFAGIGVDALFQKSDKRYWHKRCACGRDVRIAECFPDAVTEGKDGKGYLRCVKCGQDLTRFKGFWIPEVKANCEYEGYHVTHLMAPWIDPLDVLRDFNDPPMGDISRIYRNRLGFPHANTKDQLQVESVIECCGQNVMPDHHAGPCAMGVDIGIVKHVVIGIRIGRDRYQIVKVAQVADLEEVDRLAERYRVRCAVLDARPETDLVRNWRKKSRFPVFLCQYLDNSPLVPDYNTETGIVKADRTTLFDTTHRLFVEKAVVLPRTCLEIKEFAEQCCKTAKVLVENKRTGAPVARYVKLGDEHYRNAVNYFVLAASNVVRSYTVAPMDGQREATAVHEYDLVA